MGTGEPLKLPRTEHVEAKFGASFLEILDTGYRTGVAGVESVVFSAWAVLAYEVPAKSYKFHAFRDIGQSVVADVEITEKGLIWSFEDGRGGRVATQWTMTVKRGTRLASTYGTASHRFPSSR